MRGNVDCPCGCGTKPTSTFLDLLITIDKFVYIFGNTHITISSGARCEKHNKEVGGLPGSAHLLGIAADIPYNNDKELFNLVNVAMSRNIVRIVIYKKRKFIHIDVATQKMGFPEHIIKLEE
jgi:uncharacterized protein YcbK (DUF882 family)